MPFNVSPSSYIGGQLLASGIGNLGEGLAKGIGTGWESYQRAKEEQSANDIIIDYAVKNNLITPEEHTKYLEGSKSQKNGVVAGLTRTYAMDMQRQNAEAQRREMLARTNRLISEAAPFMPTIKTVEDPATGGKVSVLTTSPHSIMPVPGTSRQPDAVVQQDGFFWDGKKWVQKRAGGPLDLLEAVEKQNQKSNMKKILEEIAEAQGQIDAGNVRSGPDWLPLGETYESKVKRLRAQRDALTPSLDEIHDLIRDAKPATPAPNLSTVDQQALSWARSNSHDPRASKILARLGLGNGTAAPSPTQGGRPPQMGERRIIQGVLAEWDGKGWLPSQGSPAAPGGKVLVKSPDGKVGYIPGNQLQAALQQGYTQINTP
jgi:hypothetical protein